MRMANNKRLVMLGLALLALTALVFLFARRSKSVSGQPVEALTRTTNVAVKAVSPRKRSLEQGAANSGKRDSVRAVQLDSSEREAISALAKGEVKAEKELSALYAKVLGSLSDVQRKVAKMRMMINAGQKHAAMRMARDLMDAEEPEVRKQVVSTFRWYGGSAIRELTQLLSDPSEEVRNEAVEAWRSTFEEFPDDDIRAETLLELIPTIQEREQIDALLMNVTKMRPQVGLETLAEIIDANPESQQGESAREMWTHMTDSFEYRDKSSVQAYLNMIEEDQREASEKWAAVRAAIVEANGDVNEVLKILGIDPSLMERYMNNQD